MRPSTHTVLIGAGGQLAFDVLRSHPGEGQITGLKHADLDLCDHAKVADVMKSLRPTHVVSLAAFHNTDACESDYTRAFAVNCYGVLNLARVCRDLDIVCAYVSTDYIFGGSKREPYTEADRPDPINVYGMSKRAGECAVEAYASRSFIFRVSGLYGVAGSAGKGGNFVDNRIRDARLGKPIRMVDDQVLTPTHCGELASAIWSVLATDCYGTYHLTQSGQCSWYDFTAEIFRQCGLSPQLERQKTSESGAAARRPRYSVLENARLKAIGLPDMKPWREALNDYLVEKHGVARISDW